MVFFTCDKCGEALKKNQVERHYLRCGSNAYSCIDCQKAFDGYTYAEHIKCISEDQKYGGLGYVEKPKKGEMKQESWVEQVSRAIDRVPDADERLRQLLKRIQNCSNIPRKEAKFMNFLKNSLRINQENLCRQAWSYIMAEMKSPAVVTAAEEEKPLKKIGQNDRTEKSPSDDSSATTAAADDEAVEPPAAISSTKRRKRSTKKEEEEAAEEEDDRKPSAAGEEVADGGGVKPEPSTAPKFKWKSVIKRKLRESDGQTLKFKRLRRAVVSEYRLVATGQPDDEPENDETLFAQFADRLTAVRGVQINGKLVSLEE